DPRCVDADAEAALGDLGHRLAVPAEPDAQPAREHVGDKEADVVAVRGVLAAGVAQADDQPGRVVHGYWASAGASTGSAAGTSAAGASAGAPAPSASSSSAVGAAATTTSTVSGSAASSTPSGSVTLAAVTRLPAARPSIESSRWSGRRVASARMLSGL